MNQNKIIFGMIIGVALLVITGLFILELVGAFVLPTRTSNEATIEILVPNDDTAIYEWVQSAAQTFNQQDEKQQVTITRLRVSDTGQLEKQLNSTQADVWLAEADFWRTMSNSDPFAEQGDAIAYSPLVWVAVQSIVTGEVDWQTMHDLALNDFQFQAALPPIGQIDRLAACLSATASYHDQADLTSTLASDRGLQTWFDEFLQAVPNPRQNPADQLSSRPPKVDVGLLPYHDAKPFTESTFQQIPARYQVGFNYPYLIREAWSHLSPTESANRQEVAQSFHDFLLSDGQQNRLATYNLQPASAVSGQTVTADGRTVQALKWCWQ
ncbi:substrate-binding domain-containing protein [Anaerolineales bacterium HSG25]|nr:substrate-binding domain-containing protein [Anaerolineales bacterium HSG25]